MRRDNVTIAKIARNSKRPKSRKISVLSSTIQLAHERMGLEKGTW